jgi:hypothetical protein
MRAIKKNFFTRNKEKIENFKEVVEKITNLFKEVINCKN